MTDVMPEQRAVDLDDRVIKELAHQRRYERW
jgi:hypothetical protein